MLVEDPSFRRLARGLGSSQVPDGHKGLSVSGPCGQTGSVKSSNPSGAGRKDPFTSRAERAPSRRGDPTQNLCQLHMQASDPFPRLNRQA